MEERQFTEAVLHRHSLPITEKDVITAYIAPWGFSYQTKTIGNIDTKNYFYCVGIGNKFSHLAIANYDQICLKYERENAVPIAQLNTNAAYQLATQWLAAASMDVNALEKDCQIRVAPTSFWNRVKPGTTLNKPMFVPIYDLHWLSAKNVAENYGDVAHVELFLPTKTILQLGASCKTPQNRKDEFQKSLIFGRF